MNQSGANSSPGQISAQIKERALASGFDKVGIAAAVPLERERGQLAAWLARNYHAQMRWMERDVARRADPQLILDGARSVVAVALNYYTAREHEENDDRRRGKISRYAWGDDYHDVVGEKLRSLLAWIKEQWPGTEGKICVDAQPTMDKAWAVRAGLGWVGKHSNVITREYGSWVFLGELILTLETEHDRAFAEDHCGTCTLCLDVCPTGAIVEPRVVDSARCISHATIELREPELPSVVAENLNDWLYGCDDCQTICPWNRFEKPTDEPRFEPRLDETSPDLNYILQLTPETYAERFRRSPVKRAKLSGLQRNARALLQMAADR